MYFFYNLFTQTFEQSLVTVQFCWLLFCNCTGTASA